jgi:hypothetical protein
MIYEQISPLIKLRRQNTIRLFRFDIPWTRQPNPVITHWSSTTNPGICPIHQIQHEVIQAKYPAIEICNTLKTEGRKRFFTLCTVEVASRAI